MEFTGLRGFSPRAAGVKGWSSGVRSTGFHGLFCAMRAQQRTPFPQAHLRQPRNAQAVLHLPKDYQHVPICFDTCAEHVSLSFKSASISALLIRSTKRSPPVFECSDRRYVSMPETAVSIAAKCAPLATAVSMSRTMHEP